MLTPKDLAILNGLENAIDQYQEKLDGILRDLKDDEYFNTFNI